MKKEKEKLEREARKRDYNWFIKKAKIKEHMGEWVAIANKNIVASGKDVKKVLKEAQKVAKEPIALAKIPKEEVLIL